MQETLSFLQILDSAVKRNPSKKLTKEKGARRLRFPYARAVMFEEREEQYNRDGLYPRWLTKREEFLEFMYQNYEKKLMSIPAICEKDYRASDERYFVGLYLQQNPLFANLPQVVSDFLNTHIRTQYVRAGQVVHNGGPPAFMAVVFAGVLTYRRGKDIVVCQKNSVIMTDAFSGRSHEPIHCREQAILLVLQVSLYPQLTTRLREDIEMRERDEIADLQKSTFFRQLQIKDRKAASFYEKCSLRFYLDGQVIAMAGSEVSEFYLVFRGQILQQNHIYIREHNKWPLPARKWQVRAVYNSYHKQHTLRRFDFFGDEQITTNSKFKSKYVAKGPVIIFSLPSDEFISALGIEEAKRLKKYRNQHIDINYGQFQINVRQRVRSLSQQRNIVRKTIGGALAHRDNLTARRISMIDNFEKSMLNKTFFEKGAEREL